MTLHGLLRETSRKTRDAIENTRYIQKNMANVSSTRSCGYVAYGSAGKTVMATVFSTRPELVKVLVSPTRA